MKKFLFVILTVFIISVPFISFAQTDKEIEDAKSWLGQWKRNFAQPSYGLALFHGWLDGGWYGENTISDDDREFPATAMDFRIFKGVNVSKRGGFYTGVETGVLFLAPFADVSWFEPTLQEEMHLEYTGGLVFLMAKYGLRADFGIALFGLSVGLEMGMGGSLFAGGINFYTGERDNRTADIGYGTSTANMGLILDVAGETAIRLGKNFRFFAKAGVMAAPIGMPRNDNRDDYNVWIDETVTNVYYAWDTDLSYELTPGTDEYRRAIMSQYDIDLDPFCLAARVGFSLNFN